MARVYTCKTCRARYAVLYPIGKLREYCAPCKENVIKARDRKRIAIYNQTKRGKEVNRAASKRYYRRKCEEKQPAPPAPRYSEKRAQLAAIYAKHGLPWNGGNGDE